MIPCCLGLLDEALIKVHVYLIPHRRRKVLNEYSGWGAGAGRGEGQGSEYWGGGEGGQAGPKFLLAVN